VIALEVSKVPIFAKLTKCLGEVSVYPMRGKCFTQLTLQYTTKGICLVVSKVLKVPLKPFKLYIVQKAYGSTHFFIVLNDCCGCFEWVVVGLDIKIKYNTKTLKV